MYNRCVVFNTYRQGLRQHTICGVDERRSKMKNHVKGIAVLLAVLMLFSVAMCACTPQEDPNDDTSDTAVKGDPSESSTKIPGNDISDDSDVEDSGTPSESETYPVYTKLPFKFTAESITTNNKINTYRIFNNLADPAYLIPALNQYFVPQGMDIWEEMGWLMISGYFTESTFSSCSVLLALDLRTGEYVGEYYLKNSDGSDHTGHAGGVAITSKNLFISNGKKLHRIPLDNIKAANRMGDIRIVDTINVPVSASFCNYSAGVLWVGDFYESKSYKTDTFRHMKNRSGDMYYAWCVGYKLSDEAENEIAADKNLPSYEYATPDIILSIREKVQGFAVVSDKYIALSCSYGRTNDSTIYLYNNVLDSEAHGSYKLNGTDVPLWFLDSKTGCKSYKSMPMTEGLAAYNGKLLILYESGADKYRNGGGKYPTDSVWTMNMPSK